MFRRSKNTLALALMVPLVASVGLAAAGSSSAAASRQQSYNGSFDAGRVGWIISTPSRTAVSIVGRGVGGGKALKVVNRSTGGVVVAGRQSRSGGAGLEYAVSAWVRTNQPGTKGRLVLKETRGKAVSYTTKTFTARGAWSKVSMTAVTRSASSTLQLRFGLNKLNKGRSALIDALSFVRPATGGVIVPDPTTPPPTTPPTPPPPTSGDKMSNGCPISSRGIPTSSCGALLGSAYGSNTEPSAWENEMGHALGIRRSYYGQSHVDKAVAVAKADLAKKRLPWISFKLPFSWSEMAAGKGDAWTRDLSIKLSKLNGPVWLAFHHEPEGDGDIKQWTAMQAHLAPIVRANASNVSYSIVVTGWNQLYGAAQYSLDSLWPKNTKIDLLGVDVYNKYGAVKDGKKYTTHTDMENDYFKKFGAWANPKGIAWGVAETGFTDAAAESNPQWVQQSYNLVKKYNGVGFTYFNTTLNSIANWALTTATKKAGFKSALRSTPTL